MSRSMVLTTEGRRNNAKGRTNKKGGKHVLLSHCFV